jgi:hypothetical protein
VYDREANDDSFKKIAKVSTIIMIIFSICISAVGIAVLIIVVKDDGKGLKLGLPIGIIITGVLYLTLAIIALIFTGKLSKK